MERDMDNGGQRDTHAVGTRLLTPAQLVATAAACASVALVYGGTLASLVSQWSADDNYSHGFLVFPLAAYFLWTRRAAFRAAPIDPNGWGVAIIVASLAIFVAGSLGSELFLSRLSLLGVVAGTVLFLWGSQHLRIAAFPIAFLLLMIPWPAILFNEIAFPLQLVASWFGEVALHALAIPATREGNIITLAGVSLEVAEACSGIRSLVSLFALSIVFGYFGDARTWVRTALALMTVPIAVVVNGLRVAGIGVAAYWYGAGAATDFVHSSSGWLVFLGAIAAMFVAMRVLELVAPAASRVVEAPGT